MLYLHGQPLNLQLPRLAKWLLSGSQACKEAISGLIGASRPRLCFLDESVLAECGFLLAHTCPSCFEHVDQRRGRLLWGLISFAKVGQGRWLSVYSNCHSSFQPFEQAQEVHSLGHLAGPCTDYQRGVTVRHTQRLKRGKEEANQKRAFGLYGQSWSHFLSCLESMQTLEAARIAVKWKHGPRNYGSWSSWGLS